MEELRKDLAERSCRGEKNEMFEACSKTKRGGVMKKFLTVLGALFCLMAAGGGLTGCTATVEVGLTEYYITLDPGLGKIPAGQPSRYKSNAFASTPLPDPYDPLEEYRFIGWFDKNGVNVGKYYTDVIYEDITLYARWQKI